MAEEHCPLAVSGLSTTPNPHSHKSLHVNYLLKIDMDMVFLRMNTESQT